MRRWKLAGRRAGAAGTCEPGARWWLLAAACLAGVLGLLGWLFYRSLRAVLILQAALPALLALVRREEMKRRRWELTLAFKDAAESLGAALGAGYSVDNAFRAALEDLRSLYPAQSVIVREFEGMLAGAEHRDVETALAEFAERSGIEEADHLAQVMLTGRRTGGNLPAMIEATARGIEEKIEMKRELSLMIAAKQLESRILCLLPCGMILYLQLCSPGFLDPLYEGLFGRLLMSVLLGIYAGAVLLSEKIASACAGEV